MDWNLNGKGAFVTGAKGIGRAIAIELADTGPQ
jgi:NAD(P)-dependent dehydrogenase (short-subunit alcohol dehydrogenase family)